MNCPNCGLAANENDKFCIGCGTRLRVPDAPAERIAPLESQIPEPIEEPAAAVEPEPAPAVEPIPAPAVESIPAPAVEPEPITVSEPIAANVVEKAEEPVFEPAPAVQTPPVEVEYEKEPAAPVMNRLNRPLSTWGYVWRILLFLLPIINIVPLFVMAFSKGINRNSKHFASAVLILMLICLILCVCGLVYLLLTTDAGTINQFISNLFSRA